MKKINLKGVVISKHSDNKTNYTDEKNYNIYLPKKDLDILLFSLNTLIIDIQNNQDKSYLVSQIEKMIFILKNFDIPPEIQLNNIPTFETVHLDEPDSNRTENNINNNKVENKFINNLLELNLKDLGIDTNTYCSYIQNAEKDKYEGELINGKKEGKGKFTYKNGCIYEGFFKNNKKEGSGIFYYTNGDRYKGQFKQGFYQGKGVFYFHNGDRYEGGFDKNKYSGIGKYFYHNGDSFEGSWQNDKKNGKGTYIYLNGDKVTGNYKNGKPVGNHIKLSTEGKTIQIKYSDD